MPAHGGHRAKEGGQHIKGGRVESVCGERAGQADIDHGYRAGKAADHRHRHDAALFTNIMRIRRLLGEDGSEIIRVTEDGYRFVPPRDFLFVIPR